MCVCVCVSVYECRCEIYVQYSGEVSKVAHSFPNGRNKRFVPFSFHRLYDTLPSPRFAPVLEQGHSLFEATYIHAYAHIGTRLSLFLSSHYPTIPLSHPDFFFLTPFQTSRIYLAVLHIYISQIPCDHETSKSIFTPFDLQYVLPSVYIYIIYRTYTCRISLHNNICPNFLRNPFFQVSYLASCLSFLL